VKPADRLKRPPVAEALSWAGEVFAGRGWEHEVWSAADPMMLANVRFLAGYRRSAMPNPDSIAVAVSLTRAGQTIADAEATLRAGGMREPRPVVLHLVWSGALRVDLTRPVTSETELAVSA